jgi:aminoglycoside phosphotransferase (APT) family kinase protein
MRMPKMHDGELEVGAALVARLIDAQFPEWREEAIEPLLPWGTDNALFRLGDDKLARLPRIGWAVGQVEKDQQWLPVLAPQLPFAIPELLALGAPSGEYPWSWGVYRWLEGEALPADRLGEAVDAERDLARFLAALRQIDSSAGPAGGPPSSSRGGPLASRDEAVRRSIAELGARVDAGAVTSIWDAALRAPEWQEAPAWLHGDLMPGNLLFLDGRLSAIIDFSVLGVGDPAADLMVAWWFLTSETRPVFRAEVAVDDASWLRGCGWALSCALIALPYYWETNPTFVRYARRALAEVLADQR